VHCLCSILTPVPTFLPYSILKACEMPHLKMLRYVYGTAYRLAVVWYRPVVNLLWCLEGARFRLKQKVALCRSRSYRHPALICVRYDSSPVS
jgi:hypothetical protein